MGTQYRIEKRLKRDEPGVAVNWTVNKMKALNIAARMAERCQVGATFFVVVDTNTEDVVGVYRP